MKRIFEIVLGLAIAFILIGYYDDGIHPGKLLIWYLLTDNVLKTVAWIILFLLASRLVYGKYKDYTGYFYRLFVKWWGDPKKKVS